MKTLKVVLASSSPRRRELLSAVGIQFSVLKPDIPEVRGKKEKPEAYVQRLSRSKCMAVVEKIINESGAAIVIAADTTVVMGEKTLEKPSHPEDAVKMLLALSGRWHTVFTGVSVWSVNRRRINKKVDFVVKTLVKMRKMDRTIAKRYVATGEPMDKAGAYGIQGFGSALVEAVRGSYTNVVGLPLVETLKVLEGKFGYRIFQKR